MTELATVSIAGERDDILVATIVGEIDISNTRAVGERLTHAVPNTATALVLDLSGVSFLDSSALRLLTRLHRQLETRQQRLAVVLGDDSPVRPVLRVSGLDTILSVVPSLEAARRVAAGD